MRCVYVSRTGELGIVDDPRLDATTERHKLSLQIEPAAWQGDPIGAIDHDATIGGMVLDMYIGWVGRDRLTLARAALARRRRVWLHWPGEQAVECVDRERLRSHWRHWLFITGYHRA